MPEQWVFERIGDALWAINFKVACLLVVAGFFVLFYFNAQKLKK